MKWKRILRLQDWDIRLRLARHSQMHNANAAGEISPFDLKRQASISILHPQDFHLAFGDALFFPQDMEYTVVHELLHIYMHPLNGKEKDEEQAIHAIATALVQCHRGQW